MRFRPPSPTASVLWCLVLGLGAGALGPLRGLAAALEPIGTLWVNAIRMTVIPLVVSLLIVGVASAASARQVGRLGGSAFILFLTLLALAAGFTALVAPWAFTPLSLDPAGTAALRASAHLERTAPAVTLTGWLLSLIPTNPVQAAADGALLPLIVFTLAFAFALTGLAPEVRDVPLGFFESVTKAMLVMVRWVLALAPLGVFALALALGARVGSAAAGAALGYYVGMVIVLHVVTGGGLYLLAVVAGRVPLVRFARAVFPAQAVGFTSRSSLAALPALVEGARDQLRLPAEVTGFVLPLAVSVFKLTSPIYWTLGAIFVGRLYGIELAPSQLAYIGAAAIALNAATPGIPSGGLLIQAPVYAAVGLPVEGLGILIAIDTVPDMFKTAFNVTADMAVAAVLGRPATPEGAA